MVFNTTEPNGLTILQHVRIPCLLPVVSMLYICHNICEIG